MADQAGIPLWLVYLCANAIVAGAYFTIFSIVARGLARSGQLWTNRLGMATAAIFFSCGMGHLIHVEHLFTDPATRTVVDWHLAGWDLVTACVAIFYLSLRRSYGKLLDSPTMFDDAVRSRADALFRTAFAHAPIGIALVGIDGSWLKVNDALCRIVGRTEDELLGLTFQDITHPDDLDADVAEMERLLSGELDSYQMEKRYLLPDGTEKWVSLSGAVVRDDDARPLHFIAHVEDIDARRRSLRDLARFSALVEGAEDAIFTREADGRIASWNPAAERLFGWTADEAVGQGLTFLSPPGFTAEVEQLRRRVLAGEPVERREVLRRRKDGDVIELRLTVSAIRDDEGRPVGWSTIAQDLGELRREEAAREEAERLFGVAFEQAPTGILVSPGFHERIDRANAALLALGGWTPEELGQRTLRSLVHPDDVPAAEAALARLAEGQPHVRMEVRLLHAAGHAVWALMSCAEVKRAGGRLLVTQVLDISERKHFEGRLQHLADHDALTGLYNRRRFDEELTTALAGAKRYGWHGALLLLDLDGFKYVNDTLGHSVGDELITRVGGILRSTLRDTDVLARLGGDEFGILLAEADAAAAADVAERILAAVRLQGTVAGRERHARVTTSIGITLFDGTEDISGDDLLAEADIAMYDAKEAGRNAYKIARSEEERRARMDVRASWLERLRDGLAEDRFILFAQPIVGIGADGLERHELLLRFRAENGDLVPPGTFLYIAERFDLIGDIDRWVLAQAVELLHREHEVGRPMALSVNLSGKTLSDPDLPGYLRTLLARRPVPEGRLIVEVTETAAIVNIERAREFAETLHELGCRFALDDFGAGFASFYYLKHLTFDYVKIDGEFVKDLPDNPTDQLVIRAIVDIARGLGTRTVAEFVGDARTVEVLEELGVDYGQGFHLGRPAPVAGLLTAAA